MDRRQNMTERERMRRREQMRRKKRRRLRRKIRRICRLTAVLALLLVAVFALKKTNVIPGHHNYEMEKPVQRTEEEVQKKLEEMAKKHKEYKDILEHYEDYPETYLAALANNPEMLDYVKGYLDSHGVLDAKLTKSEKKEDYPLFIQWDKRWGYASYGTSSIGISGCGPTCLSMVIYGLTENELATPDKVARYSEEQGYYIEGTGTSWELMTDGAAAFGVTGSELSLDESSMKQALDAGHPIICAMRAGDFTAAGHFIMIYGYDKKGFIVNDPNSRTRSEKRWTYEELNGQIKNLWSYQ
ncbi:MAG: C39 family peptidase [Lachnospiraceae bacterium]|jgi:hypothetical protein|nr:C39 family peptidase [Lachnospiraceae bacterium]